MTTIVITPTGAYSDKLLTCIDKNQNILSTSDGYKIFKNSLFTFGGCGNSVICMKYINPINQILIDYFGFCFVRMYFYSYPRATLFKAFGNKVIISYIVQKKVLFNLNILVVKNRLCVEFVCDDDAVFIGSGLEYASEHFEKNKSPEAAIMYAADHDEYTGKTIDYLPIPDETFETRWEFKIRKFMIKLLENRKIWRRSLT